MSEGNDLVHVTFQVSGYPGESAAADFSVRVKDEAMDIGSVGVAFGNGTPFDSAGGATIVQPGKSVKGNAGVDLKAFTGRGAKAILSGTVGPAQFFFEKDVPMGPPEVDAGNESEE